MSATLPHIIPDEELTVIAERVRNASTKPWRVESDPERLGENWWLFDCGRSVDGKNYYVTTDNVPASEDDGDPATDAAFIVWCRNDMGRLGNAYVALRAVYDDLLAACEAMGDAFSADEMQLSILMIGGKPIQESPELLARCDRVRKAHEMRRAAIAKAKGETP